MNSVALTFIRRASQCPCTPSPRPTCCEPPPCKKPRLPPYDCITGPSGCHPIPKGGYKKYSRLFYFVCAPLIFGLSWTVLANHEPVKRQKFLPYPWMRKRDKQFPWSGGTDKTFFHNPEINALPGGYEN